MELKPTSDVKVSTTEDATNRTIVELKPEKALNNIQQNNYQSYHSGIETQDSNDIKAEEYLPIVP